MIEALSKPIGPCRSALSSLRARAAGSCSRRAALKGLLLAGLSAGLGGCNTVAQARFLLTLEVETSQGDKSASSVIQVRQYRTFNPPSVGRGTWLPVQVTVTGYAPIVEIQPYGWMLVGMSRGLGHSIIRAYSNVLNGMVEDQEAEKDIAVEVRLISPSGDWAHNRSFPRPGGSLSQRSIDARDQWADLKHFIESGVRVSRVYVTRTTKPLLHRNPDPPDWLKNMREQARSGSGTHNNFAANAILAIEEGGQ